MVRDKAKGRKYEEPRAHELRERYLAVFGGDEIPLRVESIAEDLLGLRVEHQPALGLSAALVPVLRRIVVNADDIPARRRFTVAHEVGHWICHAGGSHTTAPVYCRAIDLAADADRAIEREANVFAAELLMPEPAVRTTWAELNKLDATAARFGVSPTAMQWRLHSFGLVEAPT